MFLMLTCLPGIIIRMWRHGGVCFYMSSATAASSLHICCSITHCTRAVSPKNVYMDATARRPIQVITCFRISGGRHAGCVTFCRRAAGERGYTYSTLNIFARVFGLFDPRQCWRLSFVWGANKLDTTWEQYLYIRSVAEMNNRCRAAHAELCGTQTKHYIYIYIEERRVPRCIVRQDVRQEHIW